jgi:hypothetical protein
LGVATVQSKFVLARVPCTRDAAEAVRTRCEHQPDLARPPRVKLRRRVRRTCRAFGYSETSACPRVPPQNLNGKEGVDGSSPSEGFEKALQTTGYFFRVDLHGLQYAMGMEPFMELSGPELPPAGPFRHAATSRAQTQGAGCTARRARSRLAPYPASWMASWITPPSRPRPVTATSFDSRRTSMRSTPGRALSFAEIAASPSPQPMSETA